MLRRLAYCFLLILLAASCRREADVQDQEWDGPVIEFEFRIEGAPMVKASGVTGSVGENPYHENQIDYVDFFFYPGGHTEKAATYHDRLPVDKLTRLTARFRLNVLPYVVDGLIFPKPDTEETTVLAICNGPDCLASLEGDETIMDNIYALEETTDFEQSETRRQEHFMMSGITIIKLAGRSQKEVSQGVIDLKRYACKITVGVDVEEEVAVETSKTDDLGNKITEYWVPRMEFTKIYLVDGLKTVALGGNPAGEPGGATRFDFFDYNYNKKPLTFFEPYGDPSGQIFDKSDDYYNTYPMYTYPQRWERGVGEGNTREPYLKLIVHWQRRGEESTKKEFYYKIVIPRDMRADDDESYLDCFVRNNWYHYNIKVGMLGADTDEAAVAIEPMDFYIYFWQDKNVLVKQASIGNARYLSADESDYVLHDAPTLEARYTSSHPVIFKVESVTRPYFGTKTSEEDDIGGTIHQVDKENPVLLRDDEDEAQRVYDKDLYADKSYYLSYSAEQRKALRKLKMDGKEEDWFSDSGKAIVMYHPMNDDYSDIYYDYSPYTMFIKLVHSDEGQGHEYAKKIKIVQYPAVYIKAEENSDPRNGNEEGNNDEINNAKAWMNFDHNGFVFVDGERRMRHTDQKNEGGQYGTLARNLVAIGDWAQDNGKSFIADYSFDPTSDDRKKNTVITTLEWIQWRIVNFTGGNRNMYNIFVSVLPQNSNYLIGDPRTMEPDNLHPESQKGYPWADVLPNPQDPDFDMDEETWQALLDTPHPFANGYRLDEQQEGPLKYYYPAENSNRTKHMVAPSFRVASKFGGMEYLGGATKESAMYKCATYQEDGYPAGRWRLPTEAEIRFISMLSNAGTFVPLFTTGKGYWSAHGIVIPGNNSLGTGSIALSRCVYDSWYWDQFNDRLPEGVEEYELDGITPKKYWRDHYVLGDFKRE